MIDKALIEKGSKYMEDRYTTQISKVLIDIAFCQKVASTGLGSYEAKYNTWELCEKAILEGVKGDFAEAGTYKGCHPMIMAEVARRHNDNRKIHLYDSFEGVPKTREIRDLPEAKTYGQSEGLETSGNASASLEDTKDAFRANGAPLENCVFHKGWFQNVLPYEVIPDLAVLRLDVDLLESNEICMKYLYSKLVKGGYFITDDWGHEGTGTAETWRAEFKRLIPNFDKLEIKVAAPGVAYWKKP